MIVSAQSMGGKTLRIAGNPIKMSAFADPSTRQIVPKLNSAREAILRELAENND
ncbi:MAG: hypothetical protein HQ514_12825 [Rhodospirillales bacterium]|nr:hypothetical protein [Rhodospirillales bacterium]